MGGGSHFSILELLMLCGLYLSIHVCLFAIAAAAVHSVFVCIFACLFNLLLGSVCVFVCMFVCMFV